MSFSPVGTSINVGSMIEENFDDFNVTASGSLWYVE
jgi:hypothetical protein